MFYRSQDIHETEWQGAQQICLRYIKCLDPKSSMAIQLTELAGRQNVIFQTLLQSQSWVLSVQTQLQTLQSGNSMNKPLLSK